MSAAPGAWWVWNRFVGVHVALYWAGGGRIGGTYRGAPSRDIPVIRLTPA